MAGGGKIVTWSQRAVGEELSFRLQGQKKHREEKRITHGQKGHSSVDPILCFLCSVLVLGRLEDSQQHLRPAVPLHPSLSSWSTGGLCAQSHCAWVWTGAPGSSGPPRLWHQPLAQAQGSWLAGWCQRLSAYKHPPWLPPHCPRSRSRPKAWTPCSHRS